jgi:hypothetical protein
MAYRGRVAVENARLVVEPKPRPRYTMAESLAASDYSQPPSPEELEWGDSSAMGRDLQARNGRKVDTLPAAIMEEVLAKLAPIFE